MITIKRVAETFRQGTFLYRVSDCHAHPGCRLKDSPVQPDGNHQGRNNEEL